MKKILFIILLFCSIKGNASKEGYVQKVYPSLLNKNFIVISNVKILWGSFGPKWGGREIKSFQNYLEPELIRDYLDKYYRFDKETILFYNYVPSFSGNHLQVNGDTICFTLNQLGLRNDNYFDNYFYINYVLALLDFSVNNKAFIEKNQKTKSRFDELSTKIGTITTVDFSKIDEILSTERSLETDQKN